MRVYVAVSWAACGFAMLAVLAGCKQTPSVAPDSTAYPQQTRSSEPVYPERSGRSERREEHGRRSGNHAQGSGVPGQFDFYLLTLSWSPEFCYKNPDKPECASRPRFVLHGLWPENADGSYSEDCSDAAGPVNPGAYRDLYPDQGLLGHEWKTHGTCSGLGADAYFSAARKAVQSVKMPPVLANDTTELQLAPQEIVVDIVRANPGLSADDMVISCGNNYLTAVEVCLGKDLKPASCGAVRSCRANVVRVVPPGQ